MGTEVTQIKVTQTKVIKEAENQALSLFNTIMKSEMGTQLLSFFEPQIKTIIEENFKIDNNSNKNCYNNIESSNSNNRETVINRDPDLDKLLKRIQACCDEQLVNKVKKLYLIRCLTKDGSIVGEFNLNLRDGKGYCDWQDFKNSTKVDVIFSLQKETLFSIINDTLSPLSAYLNGSVVINGSVSDAFPLKYLAERAKCVQ